MIARLAGCKLVISKGSLPYRGRSATDMNEREHDVSPLIPTEHPVLRDLLVGSRNVASTVVARSKQLNPLDLTHTDQEMPPHDLCYISSSLPTWNFSTSFLPNLSSLVVRAVEVLAFGET